MRPEGDTEVADGETEVADGDQRRARRARGRAAVLDTLIEMMNEGGALPNATVIAERAGVSPASLFRYFDSVEDLQHEATLEHFERNREFFEVPDIGVGSRHDRIRILSRARLALYNQIEPVARFGRARAPEVPVFAQSLRQMRHLLVRQTRLHFDCELSSLPRAAADDIAFTITSVASFESWEIQRRDFDRSDRQIARSWNTAIAALLDGAVGGLER